MENIRPKELNADVRKWAGQSRAMMEKRVRQLTNREKHAFIKIKKIKGIAKGKSSAFLASSIKSKVNTRFGVAERIVFPFAKHGFYIAVGASRGHSPKSNPRKIIDWYNFVLEKRLETLADTVVKNYADATVNAYALGKK